MEENRTLAQIKPCVLQTLLVSKEFNSEKVKNIESLTIGIIENIRSNNSIDELTEEIDQLVYQIYNLTEEEIDIIETA